MEDIERGDIVGLSFGIEVDRIFCDTPDRVWENTNKREWIKEYVEFPNLKTALLDLVTGGDRFRVIDKIFRPDAAQQIEMVEI